MKIKFKNFASYTALLNAVNVAVMCGYEVTSHKTEDIMHKSKNSCHCDMHRSIYTLEQSDKMLVLSLFIANIVEK